MDVSSKVAIAGGIIAALGGVIGGVNGVFGIVDRFRSSPKLNILPQRALKTARNFKYGDHLFRSDLLEITIIVENSGTRMATLAAFWLSLSDDESRLMNPVGIEGPDEQDSYKLSLDKNDDVPVVIEPGGAVVINKWFYLNKIEPDLTAGIHLKFVHENKNRVINKAIAY